MGYKYSCRWLLSTHEPPSAETEAHARDEAGELHGGGLGFRV